MKNRSCTICMVAVVVGLAVITVSAGDLNPPPGPISPTMHSLDEIYGMLNQNSECEPCRWQRVCVPTIVNQWQSVPLSHAFLHDILLNPGDHLLIYDAASINDIHDENYVGYFVNEGGTASRSQYVSIDVPIHNGLMIVAHGSGYGQPTVLRYRAE